MGHSAIFIPELDQHTKTSGGQQLTLRIERDLCYECAHEVIAAVEYLLTRSPSEIVVEIGKANTIDSSGLRALIAASDICKQADVGFRLDKLSDSVARIVYISGLGELLGLDAPNPLQHVAPRGVCLGPMTWKIWEHVASSDPALISALRDRLASAAEDAGACGETLCDIMIAAGEALSNAYRHGSPKKGSNKIVVRCMTCASAVVLEIEDEGLPFDPNDTPDPDPRKLKDHGMGIYLMRQAMDIVEFKSNGHGNCVRLVKWLRE